MTTDEIQALRALAERATPGPWKIRGRREPLSGKGLSVGNRDCGIELYSPVPDRAEADAAHIAACSPDCIIALLDELLVAREDVGKNGGGQP